MKAFTVRLNRLFIVLFIAAYFIVVSGWLWLNLPEPLKPAEPLYGIISRILSPIIVLTGLEQNWTLFSPEVKKSNTYNLLLITKQNGLLKLYEPPRLENMNLIQKLQHEKYRKLFMDNFPNPKYAFIRPSISRFFVRNNYLPENPPARLACFLVSNPIPLPGSSADNGTISQVDLNQSIENHFVYGVSPEDFN